MHGMDNTREVLYIYIYIYIYIWNTLLKLIYITSSPSNPKLQLP